MGAFYSNLLKIHPIYANWVPSSAMKLPPHPPSPYQNLQKSNPKGRHIYMYHVNVRPLRGKLLHECKVSSKQKLLATLQIQ